jgi:hypothetical protein
MKIKGIIHRSTFSFLWMIFSTVGSIFDYPPSYGMVF